MMRSPLDCYISRPRQVLTMADEDNHVNKNKLKVPFVCGCRNLGEALRRIAEGAAMIRTKGEAGTGNVVEAVRHAKAVHSEIRRLQAMDEVPPPPSRLPPCSMDPAAPGRRRLALPGNESRVVECPDVFKHEAFKPIEVPRGDATVSGVSRVSSVRS